MATAGIVLTADHRTREPRYCQEIHYDIHTIFLPTSSTRRRLLERHYDLIVGLYGEEMGTRVMRQYAFFYCRGLPGVRAFRERFVRIERRVDFDATVAAFFQSLISPVTKSMRN